jgi:hypothetical protein
MCVTVWHSSFMHKLSSNKITCSCLYFLHNVVVWAPSCTLQSPDSWSHSGSLKPLWLWPLSIGDPMLDPTPSNTPTPPAPLDQIYPEPPSPMRPERAYPMNEQRPLEHPVQSSLTQPHLVMSLWFIFAPHSALFAANMRWKGIVRAQVDLEHPCPWARGLVTCSVQAKSSQIFSSLLLKKRYFRLSFSETNTNP